jgi:hypothetical protein
MHLSILVLLDILDKEILDMVICKIVQVDIVDHFLDMVIYKIVQEDIEVELEEKILLQI